MSSSRKRTEHIERIRYPNPLPLPPYPPKLLAIPTPSSRYADPRTFGARLANAHPLPMVVDSEAGMPLNMTDFPHAWYTDQEIEADDNVFARLDSSDHVDEEDAFLISDLLGKLPNTSKTPAKGGVTGREVDQGGITWLRRTEYLGAEKKRRERELIASRSQAEQIDFSREAQVNRILESFAVANRPLDAIRHPTKPGLRAVEEHQLLPDPDTWATRYDVFRFGDHPGRTSDNKASVDPRLQVALLRPHTDLLDRQILSLFLVDAPEQEIAEEEESDAEDSAQRPAKTRRLLRSREEELLAEDEAAAKLVQSREEGDARDGQTEDLANVDPFEVQYGDESERIHMNHIRDYEPHDESARKDQELVLTFIDNNSVRNGESSTDAQNRGQLPPVTDFERRHRHTRSTTSNGPTNGTTSSALSRGIVYYHPVSTRASLRVRRRRVTEPRPPEHWDAISLGKRSFSMYEKIERLHERIVVDDLVLSQLPARLELPVETIIEEETVQERTDEGGQKPSTDAAEEDEDEAILPDAKPEFVLNSEAEEEVEKEKEDEESGDESSSASDEGMKSDEEMDEDELSALQAEAGPSNEEVDGEPAIESSRRSRRRGRAIDAEVAGDGVADDNEGESNIPIQPDDEDDES